VGPGFGDLRGLCQSTGADESVWLESKLFFYGFGLESADIPRRQVSRGMQKKTAQEEFLRIREWAEMARKRGVGEERKQLASSTHLHSAPVDCGKYTQIAKRRGHQGRLKNVGMVR